MWGVVEDFQITCNYSGPLGDLTGTGEQPSGKVALRKGTREVLDTPKRHPARNKNKQKRAHRGVLFGQPADHWET